MRICWLVLVILWGGCHATLASSSARCDPDLEGCSTELDATPAPVDAASIDVAPIDAACAANPALRICFSFDAPQLANPLANEGAIAIAATLANVSRVAVADGGAALLGTTSAIALPVNMSVVDILAIDATVRLDQAIPAGGRVGIMDADRAGGLSMFIYTGTTTTHRLRCNVGGVDVYGDTSIPLGVFTELKCTCEAGKVTAYRDGVKLAEATGCAAAAATTAGLQIGQNSNVSTGLPPNDWLVGTLDRVRLWTSLP